MSNEATTQPTTWHVVNTGHGRPPSLIRGAQHLWLKGGYRGDGMAEAQALADEWNAQAAVYQGPLAPKWVVTGTDGEGKAGDWWNVIREGQPYSEEQLGMPWGNFISRKWAQQTADRANALESALAEERKLADELALHLADFHKTFGDPISMETCGCDACEALTHYEDSR